MVTRLKMELGYVDLQLLAIYMVVVVAKEVPLNNGNYLSVKVQITTNSVKR